MLQDMSCDTKAYSRSAADDDVDLRVVSIMKY